MLLSPVRLVAVLALAGVALMLLGVSSASAQFGPPSTIFGSIADSEGDIPAGQRVTAYVGDTICSYQGDDPEYIPETFKAGEGESEITMYVVNVVSAEQTPGCGTEGAEVRIEIGDRFADDVATWREGLVQNDITFGNATPAPIPTTTPTPVGEDDPDPTNTPAPGETPAEGETPGGNGGEDPDDDDGTPTALPGGVDTDDPDPINADSDDDGGFPIWAMVLVGLGVIAVAGGGIGFLMARSNSSSDPEPFDRGA